MLCLWKCVIDSNYENVFYDSVDFASAPSEKSRVSLTVHVFRKNSEMTSYTRTCWLHVTVIHATRNNWEAKKSAKMIHIYLLASVLCGVGGVALLVVGVAALLLLYNRHSYCLHGQSREDHSSLMKYNQERIWRWFTENKCNKIKSFLPPYQYQFHVIIFLSVHSGLLN